MIKVCVFADLFYCGCAGLDVAKVIQLAVFSGADQVGVAFYAACHYGQPAGEGFEDIKRQAFAAACRKRKVACGIIVFNVMYKAREGDEFSNAKLACQYFAAFKLCTGAG